MAHNAIARPAKPVTHVRNYIQAALRRFAIEHHRALGRQDRMSYTYPSCIIILQGETNLTKPWAEYRGELGIWTAGLDGKTINPIFCRALTK